MIHTTDSKMERLAYSGDTNKQPILKKKLAQTWGYTTLTPTFWRQREMGRCLVYIASCKKPGVQRDRDSKQNNKRKNST